MSPTQRTLRALRERGYHAAVVERFNRFAGIRQDLFGWIDLVAAHPTEVGILGIQTTTGDHAAERLEKARGNGALLAWILSGGRLAVWGWSKRKGLRADGKRSKRDVWALREIPVSIADLTPAEASV